VLLVDKELHGIMNVIFQWEHGITTLCLNFVPFLPSKTDRQPFNGLCSRTTWVSWHEKVKPFRILMKQEILWWQWHQLDHMQFICTSLQTYSHASTSLLYFLQVDAIPDT